MPLAVLHPCKFCSYKTRAIGYLIDLFQNGSQPSPTVVGDLIFLDVLGDVQQED